MQYRRIFRMLVAAGHSGEKALEIIIEARRKSRHAVQWIRIVRQWGRRCAT